MGIQINDFTDKQIQALRENSSLLEYCQKARNFWIGNYVF